MTTSIPKADPTRRGVTIADPLRILNLPTVVARTGYPERTIRRMLAEDAIEHAPGRRFPAPLRTRVGSNRLEWREVAIVKWIEQREMV